MTMELEFAGTGVKLVTYPTGTLNVMYTEVLIQRANFAAVALDGDLYICNPFKLRINLLIKNISDSCEEIKSICEFEDGIAFTDWGDRKVKFSCPSEKNVKTLIGSGQVGTSNGTDETCSFTQVHGIFSMEKTLFLSDVVTGALN